MFEISDEVVRRLLVVVDGRMLRGADGRMLGELPHRRHRGADNRRNDDRADRFHREHPGKRNDPIRVEYVAGTSFLT